MSEEVPFPMSIQDFIDAMLDMLEHDTYVYERLERSTGFWDDVCELRQSEVALSRQEEKNVQSASEIIRLHLRKLGHGVVQ